MARFSEHRLRPEEESGGFEPDADQDETFLLERLPKYPGELGRYMPDTIEEEAVKTPERVPELHEAPVEEKTEVPAEGSEPAAYEEAAPLPVPGEPDEMPAVTLDEDFLQSLRREVAEKEELKSQQDVNEYINFQAPAAVHNVADFPETGEAPVFDLADIDAKHPSSYSFIEDTDAEAPPEQQPETIAAEIPAANSAAENAQEERRDRSALPWLAAALVLLALAGAGGWWFFKDNFQQKSQLALQRDSLRVTTENGVAPEIVKDTSQNLAALNDSLKSGVEVTQDSLKTIAAAEAAENRTTVTSQQVLKETTVINPEQADAGLTVKPRTVPQRTVREVRPKEPVLKRSENGVYMVQVYSSPSREDAEDYLARLRERNAGNAVVTSQKIRGQEWYRVRFGSFPTRTEAENAALKLGFAQSWIVQIR